MLWLKKLRLRNSEVIFQQNTQSTVFFWKNFSSMTLKNLFKLHVP